jgi:hypothetical protein
MHRLLAAFLLLLPACYKYQPPAPPQPRDATSVDASLGETWDAVIDLFATRNIPIRTIERVSGIIATEGLSVDSADGVDWADCGRFGHRQIPANNAIYNVLVRGDSATSTVRATVRWGRRSLKLGDIECTSNYVWERGLEQGVKDRAEISHRRVTWRTLQQTPNSHAPAPPVTRAASQPHNAQNPATDPEASSSPNAVSRTNDQLLQGVGFRQALTDVLRLGIITGVRELRPDTLTVDLGDGAFTSASTEYNLGQLYLAYRETTDYSAEGALELQHDGRRVGLYVPGRLTWEAVR